MKLLGLLLEFVRLQDRFLPGLATGVCITTLAAIWAARSDKGSPLPQEEDRP